MANRKLSEADALKKEGLTVLQATYKSANFSEPNVANVILECSEQLQKDAETQKSVPKKRIVRLRRWKRGIHLASF